MKTAFHHAISYRLPRLFMAGSITCYGPARPRNFSTVLPLMSGDGIQLTRCQFAVVLRRRDPAEKSSHRTRGVISPEAKKRIGEAVKAGGWKKSRRTRQLQ